MPDSDPLRSRHTEAWDSIFVRYRRLVWSIPLRFGLSREDCADVFQTTWLIALTKGPPPPEPAQVRFLASIASWATRDALKKVRQKHALPPGLDDLRQCGDPPPDEVVAGLERNQLIYEALDSLRPRERRLLEELFLSAAPRSYDELSKLLGIPKGSIGPLRARFLQRLREALAKRGIDRL